MVNCLTFLLYRKSVAVLRHLSHIFHTLIYPTITNEMPYDLLACGSNGSYQLGLGNDEDHSNLQLVSLPHLAHMKPQAFAFGGNHTLILFPDGRVFAAGSNEFGQCGTPESEPLRKFTELPGRWLEIAAGWEFSILRCKDGDLYSCGHGPRGELGHGKDIKICRSLTKIDLSKVLARADLKGSAIHLLKASLNHVVIKLENGVFVGWGACKKGQLGPIEPIDPAAQKLKYPLAFWEPQVLDLPSGPFFALGKERTLIYNELGEILYSLSQELPLSDACLDMESGAGLDLKLLTVRSAGIDSKMNLPNESSLSLKIQCGWSSVHILKNGTLSSYGRNSHGQLYNGSLHKDQIVDFAIGSEHGVFLNEENSVFAWGWGEHGNCGPGEDPFDRNELYNGTEKDIVVDMACGLATTWIIVEHLQ